MYGHNYEVKLGSDVFVNCSDQGEFCKALKQRYKDSAPENIQLQSTNANDVFEEIDFGLHYRGDGAAGLELSDKEEANLQAVQVDYRNTIKEYIDQSSKSTFTLMMLVCPFTRYFGTIRLLFLPDSGRRCEFLNSFPF